jgi:hypothetical protein
MKPRPFAQWMIHASAIFACFYASVALGFQDIDQEPQSLAFVAKNHPELVSLLHRLKNMKPDEYDSAMKEILKVRRRIEMLDKRDPELSAIELESWKIQSQIDLLLAKAVVQDKEFDRNHLQSLVVKKVRNQRKRLEAERVSLAARQKQIEESIQRFEENESERISQQVSALLKKVDLKKIRPSKNSQPTKNDSNKDTK